jgi:H+-translocating NAD(P) transhydrogenase subunit alpha
VGTTFVIDLSVLVLAGFVGYAVISKVPNTLHTPLMSGTNAIHGIIVLGGLLLMHLAHGWLEHLLLVIAIAFGTINVIGGFFVTDRMLEMFKGKEPPKAGTTGEGGGPAGQDGGGQTEAAMGEDGKK